MKRGLSRFGKLRSHNARQSADRGRHVHFESAECASGEKMAIVCQTHLEKDFILNHQPCASWDVRHVPADMPHVMLKLFADLHCFRKVSHADQVMKAPNKQDVTHVR